MSYITVSSFRLVLFSVLFFISILVLSQSIHPVQGRWDLVIDVTQGKPGWLEVRRSGNNTLVGRVVFIVGSARPISEVKVDGDSFSFTIPPQWFPGEEDLVFEGKMIGDQIEGTTTKGSRSFSWTGTRAPKLAYVENPKWGEPIQLFNGTDLSGWSATGENQWVVKSGILKSPKSGANLVSDLEFMNFRLQMEFRYPKGSNSGVYLRGRYEVQIEDNIGREPNDLMFAGIYGFLPANEMAAKGFGEWQTYDITLNGRRVTVIANGKSVIIDQVIPGITGGALDSNEGKQGPLQLQGDHGPIEFRKIVLTPMID